MWAGATPTRNEFALRLLNALGAANEQNSQTKFKVFSPDKYEAGKTFRLVVEKICAACSNHPKKGFYMLGDCRWPGNPIGEYSLQPLHV